MASKSLKRRCYVSAALLGATALGACAPQPVTYMLYPAVPPERTLNPPPGWPYSGDIYYRPQPPIPDNPQPSQQSAVGDAPDHPPGDRREQGDGTGYSHPPGQSGDSHGARGGVSAGDNSVSGGSIPDGRGPGASATRRDDCVGMWRICHFF